MLGTSSHRGAAGLAGPLCRRERPNGCSHPALLHLQHGEIESGKKTSPFSQPGKGERRLPPGAEQLLGWLQPPALLLGGVSPAEQQRGPGDQPTFLQAPGAVRVHPLGKGADDLIVRVATPRKEQHNLLLLMGFPKVLTDPAVVMQEQEKGFAAQSAAWPAHSCSGEEGGPSIPPALSSSWAHTRPGLQREWGQQRGPSGTWSCPQQAEGALVQPWMFSQAKAQPPAPWEGWHQLGECWKEAKAAVGLDSMAVWGGQKFFSVAVWQRWV